MVPGVGRDGRGTLTTLALAERRLARTRSALSRAAARVEAWPVPRVLAVLVVVEWAAVLAFALVVRHSGWIYYQGGDQLWYYTLGWLLGHGQLSHTLVGYGWSVVLAPLARAFGPNLVDALPVIVLLDVLVLLPAAMLALYGIAARIGGRLFGYWTLVVWIAIPFLGIRLANAGYHQRYTELTLPQSFGLTAMSDFPTMVAALVSLYFVAKIVLDRSPAAVDAAAGGAAAGVAIAIKPSTALFLAGPALAFLYRRRFAAAGIFAAALAPALLALAVWKQRGLGELPLLGAPSGRQVAAGGDAAGPLAGLDLGRYVQLDWGHLLENLDLLREHFWSGRLLQWLVIAGLVALARRSVTALLMLGGGFAAYVVVKGTYVHASVEDSSVFRIMMPAFPAFVVLVASLPLLFPKAPAALREWRPGLAPPRLRTRWSLVGLTIALSAAVPLVAFAAARTSGPLVATRIGETTSFMPVPANIDIGLHASVTGSRVRLSWRDESSFGGPVFYRIWRGRSDGLTCPPAAGAELCELTLPEVGATKATTFVDRPPNGSWTYRVAVAANWLHDPSYGDPYVVSPPVTVATR